LQAKTVYCYHYGHDMKHTITHRININHITLIDLILINKTTGLH